MTVPVKRLVASFAQRRLGFHHVGFMVDKVAVGQVFSEYFRFPWQLSFQVHTKLLSGADTMGPH
jgi:hypothetical protein